MIDNLTSVYGEYDKDGVLFQLTVSLPNASTEQVGAVVLMLANALNRTVTYSDASLGRTEVRMRPPHPLDTSVPWDSEPWPEVAQPGSRSA